MGEEQEGGHLGEGVQSETGCSQGVRAVHSTEEEERRRRRKSSFMSQLYVQCFRRGMNRFRVQNVPPAKRKSSQSVSVIRDKKLPPGAFHPVRGGLDQRGAVDQ